MNRLFFPRKNPQVLAKRVNPPTCILDGAARQCTYHAAAPLGTRPYDALAFQYIGDGTVRYAHGVKQPGIVRLSFFKLNPNRPRWAL